MSRPPVRRLVVDVDDRPPASPPERPATVFAVRPARRGPVSPRDSAYFPVPGPEADSVLLEAPDGNWQQHLLCTSLEVLNAADGRTLFRLAGIRARASLTDARLTVACSNFEKGGGWLGGPLALAVNLASRVRARRRRRGGVLVGQVRYESIRAVYAQNKAGWVGSELLRVVVDDGGRDLHVELTLPRDLDAAAVAGQLIRRAAAFRLGTATDAQERRRLAELAQLPPLVCERGSGAMAGATFPAGRGGAW